MNQMFLGSHRPGREVKKDEPVRPHQPPVRRALGGLVMRKESWRLSWLGRLLLFFVIAMGALWVGLSLFPFLAITHRVNTNILVVEGWVHKYAARAAVEEFQAGRYQFVFTTGGPVTGIGGYVNDYQTAASVGSDLLKSLGLPKESLQMVPSHEMGRDRTYSSAVALRNWFRAHDMSVHSLNVLTEDLHARRTWLLYQKAFGKETAIGIIAIPSPDYDVKRWWYYSEGVKDVLSEAIAFLYAKFFFHPSQADRTLGENPKFS